MRQVTASSNLNLKKCLKAKDHVRVSYLRNAVESPTSVTGNRAAIVACSTEIRADGRVPTFLGGAQNIAGPRHGESSFN